MLEETGRNDVIKKEAVQEKINYLDGSSSDKSIKSQHEFSTEFNDKNLLEKYNSNDENLKSLKIVVPITMVNGRKKISFLSRSNGENKFEKLALEKNKITKRKKGRVKPGKNVDAKRNLRRNNGKLLDFDRFLEEIYRKEEPVREKVVPKKKKIKAVKNIDSKNVSSYKKNSKIKNNKNAALYDLDNFVIQSTQTKIIEKKLKLNIFVPNYKELDIKFFNLPNFKVTKTVEEEDREDISDDAYMKYHNVYESREKEYRLNYFKKKKSSELATKKVDYDSTINISRFNSDLNSLKDGKSNQIIEAHHNFTFPI